MCKCNIIRLCFTFVLILTLTTACFARNTSISAPEPQESTSGTASTTSPSQAEEDESAPVSAETQSSEISGTAGVGEELSVIEEVPSIDRYRMRVTMSSEIPDRNSSVQIEASYIKEPPAEEITMQVDERGETQIITMYLVDGLRYMRSGEMVVQTADARMNLEELTLIQPRDATLLDERFVIIGEETVNGRATIHYQGGPEAVPTGSSAGDTFDVTMLASARIDLWVDQAEQFIVAMEVNAEQTEGTSNERIHMRFEYDDFNSPDIVIEAPADALAMPSDNSGAQASAGVENAPEPRNALGKLLGFDLLIATGSEITVASDQIVQVSSVYTVDEAVGLFQANLPANDYSFLNLIQPQAGESVLMFQKGMQTATIQITETDKGSDWNVIMAP